MRERAVFASTLHSSIPHRISFYSTRFYTALLPTLSLSFSLSLILPWRLRSLHPRCNVYSPKRRLLFVYTISFYISPFVRVSILFTALLHQLDFYMPSTVGTSTPSPFLYLHLCFVFACHMISKL